MPRSLCHTHDAAGHLPYQFLRAAHIPHIGTTPQHRDAQRLALTDRDVSAPLAGRLQHGKVGSHAVHDKQCLLFVTSLSETAVILNNTIDIGLLDDNACHTALS